MYLIPIGVPLFLDGDRVWVQTDWLRSLKLLRDSLGGRYGDLLLLSPWLPVDGPEASVQPLERLDGTAGIRARSLFDARVRTRGFWMRELLPLRRALDQEFARAEVVHTGLDDLHRPLMGLSFAMARARDLPTVFVQDTDVVVQARELARQKVLARARVRLYVGLYEQLVRHAVGRADLVLLKGGSLARRYQPFASNLHEFEDTSYLASEIADERTIKERLAEQARGRTLKLVYCGRLVERKGVHRSLEILAAARRMGTRIDFEIIGSGPELPNLERLARELDLREQVHFAGSASYGAALIERLARFDGLLFTPTAEDTPRMIFDGYAAGLPLVASAIPYAEERARREGATALLPRFDVEGSARRLVELDRNRSTLSEWTGRAQAAARYHAADAWYTRRAEWTHEAVARRRAR
ncbi:MAG: glycosyltransferase [Planctomycetaceae bacterium]|nr:glycosyltransferase [Planctomycetaceae bacterium]